MAKKITEEENIIIPTHIGIIMDGNGRWARKRLLPHKAGHYQGTLVLKKILKYCKKIGVKYLTVYAFSTENWRRPQAEVDALMELFNKYLDEAVDFYSENVRAKLIGDKSGLSDELVAKINKIEKDTENFDGMTFCVALNYGGREEIAHACREIAKQVKDGKLSIDDITEETVANNIYTAGIPDVDLVIRPSGEYRTSNFLLWQSAYAEYVFMDNVLWPDFTEKDLDKAIIEFSKRNRRFGGLDTDTKE